MIINTNISALKTVNSLSSASKEQSNTMATLSSGKRINSASDDAAGTAVSARMTTQVRGMNQAIRNANDGVAMLQTMEGALASQGDIMQRMRELAIQSANGTYSASDRANLDAEFQALWNEINRISTSVRFNGNQFLSTNAGGTPTTETKVDLQLSDVANDTLTVTFKQSDTTTLFAAAQSIDTAVNAQAAITAIDTALNTINDQRADYGAVINRLEYTAENLANTSTNLSDARSRIVDVDMAAAMSELTKYEILTQSSVAMLGKANAAPQQVLNLLRG